MDKFIEFLREGLANLVNESLASSVPLISGLQGDAGFTADIIIEMVATFVIQLLIFVVLFLIVRFKFWNLVTGFVEQREKQVKETLNERDKALEETETAKAEAAEVTTNSKKQAAEIIEQARAITTREVATIKKEAFDEIEQEKIRAQEQLAREREMMEKEIKEEIIDVAFEMSKAIVEREIDRAKNQDIVDEALGKLEKR